MCHPCIISTYLYIISIYLYIYHISIHLSMYHINLYIISIDVSIHLSMCSSINLHAVSQLFDCWSAIRLSYHHYWKHITIIESTIVSNKSHNFQLSQLPLTSLQMMHIGSNSRIHWKNTPTTHGSIAGITPYFALIRSVMWYIDDN
jgi:hypothetical protein